MVMQDEDSKQNRRKSERVDVGKMDITIGSDLYQIKDISETGFAITKSSLQVAQVTDQNSDSTNNITARFAFRLGEENKIVDCEARVIWESEDAAGLEIVEQPESSKKSLSQLVDCLKKGEKII